jgi:multisubunit Na+/H+ antiporter MnhE subunit
VKRRRVKEWQRQTPSFATEHWMAGASSSTPSSLVTSDLTVVHSSTSLDRIVAATDIGISYQYRIYAFYLSVLTSLVSAAVAVMVRVHTAREQYQQYQRQAYQERRIGTFAL